ncbi:hypothetical protein Ahy_B04g072193 isoform A [Arachis hypogaea]|uniref:TIR domain-containing protein n=1 Tax=Arachis hypogaea TaxID=3818 RepID=A0A444ZMN1_ARAHY|nr:hypothetical protein Ahy_B04g072193 isoform A [Arachis hypogaea]
MARPCTYKVFLSFRGEDTRKGFTSHLYTALVNRGITTYIDDKNLHKGDLISDELLKAIEESMFAVIVLSPNYASSTWCLDELHKIVECNNYLGLQIVAVFYHVKPCDVRHQIGAFEEAFKKHELRFGKEGDRVRRWRNALTQVVSYSNWDSERFDNVKNSFTYKEIEATHSLVLYNKMEWGFKGKQRVLDIRDLSFSNMCKLKILILDNVKGPILCNIPCTLKVLHWRRCPMKTLPFTDQSYELVDIDLSYSKIVQLWDGKKVLKKLEHLNLSNCHKLKQTPELCGALNLKTLDLSECKALNYIHPFLAHHKSLVELNLYGCSRLRRLPEFGEGMKQLSVLILTDTGIEELPTTPGKFAGVSKLDLSGCDKLTSLPLSLGCFVGLKELVLSRFMELSCVPYSTHGLESLTVEDYSDSPNIVGLLCSLSCFTSLSTLKLHVCFGTLSYNLGHLASLTDLDLSDNDFRQLPISILELPRLTRLQLYHCRFLEVLPEIPSSLRVLQADRCCSLVASKVYDAISKACCVFAESASQDREDFLQMLMPELYQEMPAWFEDQEEDNGVSLSSPSTEIIALALCFLLDGDKYSEEQPSVICNGKEFINTRLLKVSMSSYYKTLLILCLNGYSFSNLLCQDNRFQLQFPSDCCEIRVKRSGARWVCKQDVQLLKKRKYETGKRKATLKLNMDMISHSSASRNKMPVVDSPVYEEEVERATTLLASLRFASHSTYRVRFSKNNETDSDSLQKEGENLQAIASTNVNLVAILRPENIANHIGGCPLNKSKGRADTISSSIAEHQDLLE